eukprot:2191262-Rhodomonas_salina.1
MGVMSQNSNFAVQRLRPLPIREFGIPEYYVTRAGIPTVNVVSPGYPGSTSCSRSTDTDRDL